MLRLKQVISEPVCKGEQQEVDAGVSRQKGLSEKQPLQPNSGS